MSSEPRDFNALLYAFQLVVRYFCGAGFILFRLPDLRLLRWSGLIYATKPASSERFSIYAVVLLLSRSAVLSKTVVVKVFLPDFEAKRVRCSHLVTIFPSACFRPA